jgi:hypothetical protein
MRAFVCTQWGGPEVLTLGEVWTYPGSVDGYGLGFSLRSWSCSFSSSSGR